MIKAGDKVIYIIEKSWVDIFGNPTSGPTKGEVCEVVGTTIEFGKEGIFLKEYPGDAYCLYSGSEKAFEKVIEDYSFLSNEVTKKLAKKAKEQEKQKEIEIEPEVA